MNSYSSINRQGRKRSSSGQNGFLRFGLLLIASILIAVVWIKKENWHADISARYMSLQSELRQAEGRQINLSCKLADLSRVTDIQTEAMSRLGMQPTRVRPDTIWCAEESVPVLVSSISFYGL